MQASLFKFDASKKPKRFKITQNTKDIKSVVYISAYDISELEAKYPDAKIEVRP